MKALCVSAIASNQGKTILTMALLHHFKKSVRPFKMGPDFIDPQFHTKICNTPSINLDTFMMNEQQVKWIFNHYSDKEISICEGVMGFYDGMDKNSSAYDISKLLQIPTILLLDGSSSYITVSAVLKGLKTYKDDNTIKAIVLNKLSSQSHFELIKNQIEKDFSDVSILGWIKKDLPSLSDTHLGLDLKETANISQIAEETLEHIDMKLLQKVSEQLTSQKVKNYPFAKIETIDKKLVIVNDDNFSFLYHDNTRFLQDSFKEVLFVDSTKDESIPDDTDVVYIPGGYVETDYNYNKIKNSTKFKASLIKHAKNKTIYAECAGLLYLGNSVDDKKMSGILDLDFITHTRFQRVGYYFANNLDVKGHAFHYTNILQQKAGVDILSKVKDKAGEVGSWQDKKVYGTYLHVMFRNNTTLMKKVF